MTALHIACEQHQPSLSDDHADAVEGVADTHVEFLLLVGQSDDVEAVGGDVVGGTGEGDEHEHGERALQPEVGGHGECHERQGDAHDELHRHNPPALGLEVVDDGAPDGLDDPGQTEPAGVEGDLLVGESELLEHDEGDEHDGREGQCLAEIEGGHPCVGLGCLGG